MFEEKDIAIWQDASARQKWLEFFRISDPFYSCVMNFAEDNGLNKNDAQEIASTSISQP